MNRQVVSALTLGLLLVLLFSPFAALSLLFVGLFVAAAFWMVTSLIGGIASSGTDERSPHSNQVVNDRSE